MIARWRRRHGQAIRGEGTREPSHLGGGGTLHLKLLGPQPSAATSTSGERVSPVLRRWHLTVLLNMMMHLLRMMLQRVEGLRLARVRLAGVWMVILLLGL